MSHPNSNPERTYTRVYDRIDTGSHAPTFAKIIQLSEEKTLASKKEFSKLQKNDVITPSDSEWTISPALRFVRNPNGSFRCCVDYRALNIITKSDKYPIPNINSITDKLVNKTRFNKN